MLAPQSLPTLPTPRLRLRQLHAGDVADLFAIFSDPAVMRYWSHAPFRTREQAEWYLRDIDAGRTNGTHYQWGIATRENNRVIGTTTLLALNSKHRRAEIGYAVRSSEWRRGYGREALIALIAHAFGALELRRLEADIDPRNIASCRLVETLGFRLEGELRERWQVEGELQHSAIYGLLAREFSHGY
ncbi:GNAT family N-acetyltransferase [Dokdonella immobilis]|uniref:Protein N-acetyltransferase, RimJ/RimL family n=1 Tax=Dokdonella immobilis TaxID=578942 RepID=A0A1I4ZNW8_9GAMM|nr:GNAT family N-acetyltransferase [Dokdonella immobilis]SFN51961.1 Protein N-acetyltransferase, RimJ/RimL family [Dokdonella immobilis]